MQQNSANTITNNEYTASQNQTPIIVNFGSPAQSASNNVSNDNSPSPDITLNYLERSSRASKPPSILITET